MILSTDVAPTEECGEVQDPCYLISEHGLKVLFYRYDQEKEQRQLAETTLATLTRTQADLESLQGDMTRRTWIGAGIIALVVAGAIGAVVLYPSSETPMGDQPGE